MNIIGGCFRWFLGISFIMSGIGMAKQSSLAMIVCLLIGTFMLPIRWRILGKHGAFYKKLISVALSIALLTFASSVMPVQIVVEEAEASSIPEPYYNLSMHVIDVGQGLSLLFESGGRYLLYDGGDSDYSSKVVSYLKQQNVSVLDYVIASHYDADHLNGIVGALNVFEVGTLIAPNYTTNTQIYDSFVNTAAKKGLAITPPVVGQQYSLGNSTFTILAPSGSGYTDVNDYSVAIHLDCNQNSILVSGDATVVSEAEMIASGQNLDCDIFVVGHHGSAGANSQDFVRSLSPVAAVTSCKEDNQYQQPSKEVMERLQADNIPLFRTDKQGDMVFSTDGTVFNYSVNPCNDYSYGMIPEPIPEPVVTETTESTQSSGNAGDDSNFNKYNNVEQQQTEAQYVLNNNSYKFHYPSCKSVPKIAPHNYATSNESRDELIARGYSPCGWCEP